MKRLLAVDKPPTCAGEWLMPAAVPREDLATNYTLSSFPTFGEPVTLLVGLEDGPDGALKVYLGARSKGLHLLITDLAEQETFRRAWNTGGHVWMWPLPPAEAIHSDAAERQP